MISTKVRGNINYLFLSDINEEILKQIKEIIMLPKMNMKEFYNYVNKNNHSFQFIFYDNLTREKDQRLKIVKARNIKYKLY